MRGLFYSRRERAFYRVHSRPSPGWVFVTHDPHPTPGHCRRILRECLEPDELAAVDWASLGPAPAV